MAKSNEGAHFERAEKQDFLLSLKETENPRQQQKILNRLFPKASRDQMITEASQDIKGRKVRYYRHIKLDKLDAILNTGEQSARDYFDLEAEVDLDKFKEFLIKHHTFVEKKNNPRIGLKALWANRDKLEKKEWQEVLVASFPHANAEEISRAYIAYKQIEDEVLGDKSSALGDCVSKNKIRSDRGGPLDEWRLNEKTNDCLPVSLSDRIKETK